MRSSVIDAPAFYRLVYVAVSGVRNDPFVDPARVSGVSDVRIIAQHILTVVRPPIILQSSIVFGIAIAVQVGLDFPGFGDQSIPTWGNMLNDGFTNLYRDPQLVIWPALAVVITGVALTLFANALRDELGQRARPRRRRRAAVVTTAAATAADPVRPGSDTIVHEEPSSSAPAPLLLHIEGLAVGYPQADGSLDPSFTIGSQLTEPMRIKLGVSKTRVETEVDCPPRQLRGSHWGILG